MGLTSRPVKSNISFVVTVVSFIKVPPELTADFIEAQQQYVRAIVDYEMRFDGASARAVSTARQHYENTAFRYFTFTFSESARQSSIEKNRRRGYGEPYASAKHDPKAVQKQVDQYVDSAETRAKHWANNVLRRIEDVAEQYEVAKYTLRDAQESGASAEKLKALREESDRLARRLKDAKSDEFYRYADPYFGDRESSGLLKEEDVNRAESRAVDRVARIRGSTDRLVSEDPGHRGNRGSRDRNSRRTPSDAPNDPPSRPLRPGKPRSSLSLFLSDMQRYAYEEVEDTASVVLTYVPLVLWSVDSDHSISIE